MSSPGATKESHVDVLIIGAGPAGVMCANALVRAGICVRIVDKRSEGVTAGQADGCQPRTMEILQSYGLADQVFKASGRIWRAAFYNPGTNGGVERVGRGAAVSAPQARWQFGVTLSQGRVEDVFLASMKEHGLSVQWSTVPISIHCSTATDELKDPQAYANTVVLKRLSHGDDATEIVHSKFVLGSDGAHSWVRKSLGIGADGSATNSIWGVLDILPTTDLPDIRNMTNIHSADSGTLFIIPRERDLVRVYVQQPDDSEFIDPETGRADKSRASPEKILEQANKIMRPYRIDIKDGVIDWWTVYAVGQRVAERYSIHDRVIIAGDACHTHSPKAGQGMNAALGDSHNLAWKLAYVLKGWGAMSLLRTYESERRKFAQDLIDFDKKWSKLFISKRQSPADPNGVSHKHFMEMTKTYAGFISGLGLRYGPSAIVNPEYQSLAPGLVVGERVVPQMFIGAADGQPFEIQDLLPADLRFKVLVFGGNISIQGDLERLKEVAIAMDAPESFLRRFGHGDGVFDVLCFSSAKQETTDYLDFPAFFRPHWSKVLLDDVDVTGRVGGEGYAKYGVDTRAGAIAIIRPDGYVGMLAPLNAHGVDAVTAYFEAFLL
ncbi:FAD binding domain-containing protein [Cubamyces lactineus]|nr:FAD binding domain-containing protein [Cubamyces lactineus]